MGVLENEIFLSIEDTITVRAQKLVHDTLDDDIRQAGILIDQGLYDAARDILNGLDVTQELFQLDGFLNTKFIQAALFGSSQIVEPENSVLIEQPHLTDLFPNMVTQFREIINGGIKVVRDTGHKFIRAQEEDAADVVVGDGIIKSWGGHVHTPVEVFKNEFTGLFNQALDGNVNALVSMSANLTTSRLISYGFLSEAVTNGIQQYEVSEVLDTRTCPVCELMHGTVFDVETALSRVTEILNITDPAQLKARAPFPSQSATSLAELRLLSADELASRGLDTPPYHPLCRGIVVEVGRQIGTVEETIRPVRPGQIVQGPKGPTIIQPPVAATPATAPIPVQPAAEGTGFPIPAATVTAQNFANVATGKALQTLTGTALDEVLTLIVTDAEAAAIRLNLIIEG